MPLFNVTSDDTLTIYGRNFTDVADGSTVVIAFPNKRSKTKTGKNGNSIIAKQASGQNASLVLRLMRGSADDQFLQQQLAASDKDFVATSLATGRFVKRLGDGQGNVRLDTYTLSGGVIDQEVDGKEDVEGDTDQAVAVYNFMFTNAFRNTQ